MKKTVLVTAITSLFLLSGLQADKALSETLKGDVAVDSFTMSGLEMKSGVPTPESSKKLFDAMDYYGAVMTYLWSLPATGLKGWENAIVDRHV